MSKQHVKIDFTQPGRASVVVDGVELHRIRAIDITCRLGGMNVVILELIPDEIEVTGLADVMKSFATLGSGTK